MTDATQLRNQPSVAPTGGSEMPAAPDWAPARLVAFRFAAVFFVLAALPELRGVVPFGAPLAAGWNGVVLATGMWPLTHLWHLPPHASHWGTDPLPLLVFNLIILAVAGITALVWSLLDRRRRGYPRGAVWLDALVRYSLAALLMGYGWAKIFPAQFGPHVQLGDLVTPVGQLTPHRMLWAFMGASRSYAVFAGSLEVVAGLLLFSRRTSTLGALLAVGAIGNVVMLNFGYDTGVKDLSILMVVMALFVAAADGRRLARVFVLNQPAERRELGPFLGTPARNRLVRMGGLVFATWIVYVQAADTSTSVRRQSQRPRPLSGVFEVDSVGNTGVSVLLQDADSVAWRQITFEPAGVTIVRGAGSVPTYYGPRFDPTARTLQLTPWRETLFPLAPDRVISLQYAQPDSDHLVLRGRMGTGDSVALHLRRRALASYPLVNHKHQWRW